VATDAKDKDVEFIDDVAARLRGGGIEEFEALVVDLKEVRRC